MADKRFKFIVTNIDKLHMISNDVAIDERKKLQVELLKAYTLCNGKAIGISAIQLGIPKRACYVKLSTGSKIMFNPVVISESNEKEIGREGCLSLPFKHFNVERSKFVVIEYSTVDGTTATIELNGRDARIVLHEIDHMRGVILSDIGIETK